ncbi:MAG: glycerol-3-phosphate acyltransferase [Pseudomonadota bacterium]|nr:glycerol-3-phosphate acyltransferase [Pseudomonadota bacterium]
MVYFIAYLIGGIHSGVLISKFLKINDPRNAGSKNVGATNMWRLHGWQLGMTTFFFDVLKIFIINVIGYYYFHHGKFNVLLMSLGTLGHLFPIQNPYKGGKGIACTIMLLFLYNYFLFLTAITSWLISYKFTNTSGISASIAMFMCFVCSFLYPINMDIACIQIILILCLFKHRINIIDAFTEFQSN